MDIEFVLDGVSYHVHVEARSSALRLVREVCGRKDMLSGCAPQGVCGSCMVLINEKPRLLCTLRAKNLHKKNITTLASIPTQEKSDWLASFDSCAASPCGFCTPALILKAHSLSQYDLTSSQQEKALQMHMCRCMSWSNIISAINQKDDNKRASCDDVQQLCMLGLTKKVGDYRKKEMRFARPMFAPSASFQIENIHSPHTFIKRQNPTVRSASQICALIYGSQAWYRQELGEIEGTPLPTPDARIEHHVWGTQVEPLNDAVGIQIPFVDPGVLEPESVFVDWEERKIYISGQDPHAVETSFTVYALPGASNFGGLSTPNLIPWAQALAETEKKSILLSVQLSDSFRIRKKRIAQQVDAAVSGDGDVLHMRATMQMGESGDAACAKIWEHGYSKPYSWNKNYFSCAQVYSNHIATSLQRGLSLEGITAARECAIDRNARVRGIDPFSIRASLLSKEHAQWLWSCHETYVQLQEEGIVGLAVASTPLGIGENKTVYVSIVVRTSKDIEIHTGFWDPRIHRLMKERLKERTGFSGRTITVICGTEYPSWSGPSIAGRAHWYGMRALDDAIYRLLSVASTQPDLSPFVGQCFTGSCLSNDVAEHGFLGWSFVVAMAQISEEGKVKKIHLCVDIGEEKNTTWAHGHAQGAAQMGFCISAGEGFSYDSQGLPPTLLQKMGVIKAKHSPQIIVQTYPSSGSVSFGDASFCASYAAICVAQKRREA